LVAIAPFLGIIYYFRKIFYSYEIGEIFTMEHAKNYYKIGKLLFFDALLTQPISVAPCGLLLQRFQILLGSAI